jgi:hypothetical protein
MSLRERLNTEALMARLQGRPRQVLVLTRHFFNRLFQNEIIPFEEQMKEKLFTVLAVLAAVGWVLTNTLFSQYMFVEDLGQSWMEKFAFLTIFMLILAFAVLLEWDVLFLDAKDHQNLRPLPVRPNTLLASKFLSFLLFVGLFSAAANAFSVFGVAFFLPRWTGDNLSALARTMGAHVLATTAALLFTFLAFLFLEAVLLVALGRRAFRAVALALRLGLAVACVAVILVALIDPSTLAKGLDFLKALRADRPSSILFFPPMWFTSIYEILVGRFDPLYSAGALLGLGSIVALGVADFLALSFGLRKHSRRSLEVRKPRRAAAGLRTAGGRLFDRTILGHPVERAVFRFAAKTFRASAAHKVRLAGYLAVGLGLLLLSVGTSNPWARDPATAALNVLSAPIVLGFFLILGFRSGMNTPFGPEANWVFRLTEGPDRHPYFLAVRKAVVFLLILPFAVLLWPIHAWLWGAGPAAVHTAYVLAWMLLAGQAAFWRFSRIPYACLVVPGKAKLQARWAPYVLGFFIAVSSIATLERSLFRHPGRFPVFFLAAAAVLTGLEFVQRRFIDPKLSLTYVEEPEPVMVTLGG